MFDMKDYYESTEGFFLLLLNKLNSDYLLDSISACGCGIILGLIRCSTQKLQVVLQTLVARNLSNFHEDCGGLGGGKGSLALAACQD